MTKDTFDLIKDFFQPIVDRVKLQKDSLERIAKFSNTGIEGWFKVEIVAALGEKSKKLKNEGPDLELENGDLIEIKAATNFSKSWDITSPLEKYKNDAKFKAVIFLAGYKNGDPIEKFDKAKSNINSFEEITKEKIFDGTNNCLIGMVKPGKRNN